MLKRVLVRKSRTAFHLQKFEFNRCVEARNFRHPEARKAITANRASAALYGR